jgi:hypothetical protein
MSLPVTSLEPSTLVRGTLHRARRRGGLPPGPPTSAPRAPERLVSASNVVTKPKRSLISIAELVDLGHRLARGPRPPTKSDGVPLAKPTPSAARLARGGNSTAALARPGLSRTPAEEPVSLSRTEAPALRRIAETGGRVKEAARALHPERRDGCGVAARARTAGAREQRGSWLKNAPSTVRGAPGAFLPASKLGTATDRRLHCTPLPGRLQSG